jgi:hypothetical protein
MDVLQSAGMDPGRNGAVADTQEGPAGRRFASLYVDREAYLRRARRISKLTVTYVFRDVGENSTTDMTLPWQALGAYGSENVNAKVMDTLFPPGIPFVELQPTEDAVKDLTKIPDVNQRQMLVDAIDKGLAKVENQMADCVEEDGDRQVLFDCGIHLIIGGNHGLKLCQDSTLKGFTLEQYVVMRDVAGNLIEFVIQEGMVYATLPPDIQALCKEASGDAPDQQVKTDNPSQSTIALYTHGCLQNGRWVIYQEVRGKEVPGSRYYRTKEALEFIFPTVRLLAGENYGRSYVEPFEADLQTLDGYYQILTEAGAAMAQLKWLVKPGSAINKKQFAESQNGAVLSGDAEDITAVKAEKGADMKVTMDMLNMIQSRLERIFIMNSAIQRSGERVTAEEIRYMAQELDTTLGGMYSTLVTSLQRPYAELKLAALQRLGRVTKLPKGAVKVTILTGDAGLGRQKKAQALDEWAQTASAILTPQVFASYIKPGTYLTRSGANKQIETDGLIMTDDEVQAKQQQAQQQAMMQQAAPAAVTQIGQMAQNSQQAQLAPPQGDPAQQPQQAPQGA